MGHCLLFNNHWLAWKLLLQDEWRSEGRDIGWAEMVVVKLALRTIIASGRRKLHIIIHSDNQGVIHSI